MINFLCLNIRLMRFFGSIKVAKMLALAVHPDTSNPFFGVLGLGYAKKSARDVIFIGQRSVAVVNQIISQAKVDDSIVRLYSIDMINVLWRNKSMHDVPCNTVSVNQFPLVTKYDVAIFGYASNLLSRVSRSKKQSSIGTVNKIVKINVAHAVAPYKQWFEKWRLSVDSTGPLRHYKGTIYAKR